APLHRRAPPPATAAHATRPTERRLLERIAARGAPAKERREEIAEAVVAARVAGLATGAAATRPAAKLEPAAEIRWRPKLLARLPVAAELVVGGAFFRVLENLVGLLHLLELRLGVLLLADVGVKLPREAPIGLLDVVGGGGARHPEGLV